MEQDGVNRQDGAKKGDTYRIYNLINRIVI